LPPGRRARDRPIGIASRLACAALVALAAAAALAQPVPRAGGRAADRGADFDALWRAIDTQYAYFDRGDAAWKQARAVWRPRAVHAATQREFVAALEGVLDTLGDDHVSLSVRTPESSRRIPGETDVWARWKDDAARVEAVRTYSDADVAGLKPGDVVVRVEGEDVEEAVRKRAGEGATAQARDRALRRLLAGPRFGTLHLAVRDGPQIRTLSIARAGASPTSSPPVLARRMGDARDLGYIRIRGGPDDAVLLSQLDASITVLRGTRGLIVDLRESAGAATPAATASILARFAPAGTPWQLREPRKGARIVDTIPAGHRSPPYGAPLVVLVDRWTEGEAEALAAGLHEAAHARIAGTPAAGLRGELRSVTLPRSRIVVRFPAERTRLLDGTPRESLAPDIPVDLAAPSGGPGDPILYQALKAFEPSRPAR
jgi:C-terminal processing protease CtpA/Prc